YGLWQDIKSDVLPQQTVLESTGAIELPRGRGGHFRVTVEINGVPTELLVDTGASDLVLSLRDAERAGIDTDNIVFTGQAQTANGIVRTAFTRLDEISVGPLIFNNVGASINQGDLDTSLLGMSFLDRFERIEIRGDRMILTP
ncbi:MAG: TIGR02281 family clan AA aspartic protease, partial [Pseudomonadota bacterium]